jgi:hypothetical protein
LKTHFDFMTQHFTGCGTRFHVSMPVSEANSSSAAFNQQALFGDLKSCFQVLGASTLSTSTDLAQFPNLSGTHLEQTKRGVDG